MNEELSLRRYLSILWRRRWIVAGTVAVACSAAMAWSTTRAPVYEATASVFVGPRTLGEQDVGGAFQELLFSRELVGSYADMFKRLPLAQRVVERDELDIAPEALRSSVRTRIVPETRTIEVTIGAAAPGDAARIANSLVDVFVAQIQGDFGGKGGAPVSVLEHAILPDAPSSPKPVRDGVLAAFVGIAVGIGAALLLESLNTRIRSRSDVEAALPGVPVLGVIPTLEESGGSDGIDGGASGPGAEAFRILRTNLLYLAVHQGLEKILFTSPSEGEGKSVVVSNLATALVGAGVATVVVDGDLRRPVQHRRLGVAPEPGVADVLGRSSTVAAAIARPRESVAVLPAGRRIANPADVLSGGGVGDLLREAAALGDVTLVDSPPVLPVADAASIVRHVDCIVLVVRARQTDRALAREAVESIRAVGGRVAGVVFNGAEEPDRYSSYVTDASAHGLPVERVRSSPRGDWPAPGTTESGGAERDALDAPSPGESSARASLHAALEHALLQVRQPGRKEVAPAGNGSPGVSQEADAAGEPS